MARGQSGRIVLEINPAEKRELYDALTRDGMTLKDWFLSRKTQYLRERGQGQLFSADMLLERHTAYRVQDRGASKAGQETSGKAKGKSTQK